MDTVAGELVSFFQALKSGSPFHYLILLAVVLIGLALKVLKRSQRALKGSVSHAMLQTDFKRMTSVVPYSLKAGLQRKPEDGGVKNAESDQQPGRQASLQ